MLSRRPADDPDVAVMREMITRIDALTSLIQDLLLFAKPRALRPAPIELRPLLLDAVTSMRRDPIGERVRVDIDGPEVALTGDGELLRAAFLNLFLNSAQAMNGTGAVHVIVAAERDSVRIELRDEGPGIPTELRERVFEPFYTTKAQGGGLGLAIVRRTVDLHGGTIAVTCPPGGGTIMTLSLPRRSAGATLTTPATAREHIAH